MSGGAQRKGRRNRLPVALVPGMTLRDYFAASVWLTESEVVYVTAVAGPEQHAREAVLRYEKADAMLRERKRKGIRP
jgi:hypothetical protein